LRERHDFVQEKAARPLKHIRGCKTRLYTKGDAANSLKEVPKAPLRDSYDFAKEKAARPLKHIWTAKHGHTLKETLQAR